MGRQLLKVSTGAVNYDTSLNRCRFNRRLVWSPRDSDPCLNSTTTSPFIIAGFATFSQVWSGSLSFSLQLHVDEFYF